GILRIDDDARDRLRLGQPELREGFSAVDRLVDAVAEGRGLAIVRFAGSDIYDAGVRRVNGDVADRCRAVAFEDGLERDRVVFRLEDASGRITDINDVGVGFRYRDVVDPAAHAGRPDRAEMKGREQRVVRRVDRKLSLAGGPGLREDNEWQRGQRD